MSKENLTKDELELRKYIQEKLNMTDEEFENTSAERIKVMLQQAGLNERMN